MARGGVRENGGRARKAPPSNALEIEGWKVYRFDTLNWAVEKGNEIGFFPNLSTALVSVFHKTLKVNSTVENLLRAIENSERKIIEAVGVTTPQPHYDMGTDESGCEGEIK